MYLKHCFWNNKQDFILWKEIEAAYQTDPVIFVPMGSMEEHGPHVPVGGMPTSLRAVWGYGKP
ncbi:MAG: creatininase family protein [Lachnospiraceae bacterium]|nr:creatininase family protein [Lachnospiraceae bacterium]